MNSNRVLYAFIVLGAIVLLFFAISIFRDSKSSGPKFDFSGITRPILYDESPRKGDQNPDIVIYEYGDFTCPHCLAMEPVIKQIIGKYKSKVLFVWKDFPVLSANSIQSATAARCAGEQGKFWEYHDWLFNNQESLLNADSSTYQSASRALSLNEESFAKCLSDDKIKDLVERDFAEGMSLGIDSTPTIVIGDVALEGEREFGEIDNVIITELNKIPNSNVPN